MSGVSLGLKLCSSAAASIFPHLSTSTRIKPLNILTLALRTVMDFPTVHVATCASRRVNVTEPVSSAHFASTSLPSLTSTGLQDMTFKYKLRPVASGPIAFTLMNFGFANFGLYGGFSDKAAIPGSSLPSSSSNDAPPPVEQCVTLSSVSYFLQHVAVSPPPMIVTTFFFVAFTTSSMSAFVPFSNEAISNTPIGPFQMMVFAFATAAAFSFMLSSPQSKPMKSSGIPSFIVAVLISPSSPNFEETVKSTGRTISTFFSFAFSMISGTILAPSSSNKELPILMPSFTFKKVYAMPPPIIIIFTLSSIFLMSWILSLTFAPPRIAKTGRLGVSRTLANASNSFCTRKPHARWAKPSPTMLLCAL
mmetsp:Transcript_111925/g.316302  ORF Transcript_111925/g.316302 Transcript_111925/m.316302 type:complete len:363 (+) Transcript_111925:164-1252(+)